MVKLSLLKRKENIEKPFPYVGSFHQIEVFILSEALGFYSSFNKRNEDARIMRKVKVCAYAFYQKTSAPFVVTAYFIECAH